MSAVGMDLEEPEAAMIDEAEYDPPSVGRVGANRGVDVSTLIMRYEMQVRPVWADDGDVCRDSGDVKTRCLGYPHEA